MSEKPGRAKRGLRGLLLALVVLLVVAIVVNYQTISEIARGEQSVKGIIYGWTRGPEYDLEDWEVPEDTGAEDAKVVIEVFLCAGDPCHVDSLVLGEALGTVDPERIRVIFQDTSQEEARARVAEVRLGCEQGLAINGETKFTVPVTAPEDTRKEKVIYLAHDGGGSNADLCVLLDRELKEAYDGEGLPISAEELSRRVAAAVTRLTEEAEEKTSDE